MMNTLSLTRTCAYPSFVNGIRQNKQSHRSICLYTYNNRIRSTMIHAPECNSPQAGSIFTLKTSKILVSYSNLTRYYDQKFSSCKGATS